MAPGLGEIAHARLESLGLKISFGQHVRECNILNSSSVRSRVEDLHDAFRDPSVKLVLCAMGGFTANDLLPYIDWDLIKSNPKALCGFSDITILNNAIYAKTGLVSYYGPMYSNLGQKLYFDYTLEHFRKALFESRTFTLNSSAQWSDDKWRDNQADRHLIDNEGYWVMSEGEARGIILGGHLATFNLLQGTEYFPPLKKSIVFLEADAESLAWHFDRDLESLTQQADFSGVCGLVIGRFSKACSITREVLEYILKTKSVLANIPIVANVDFGHTDPKITFPIGGRARISAQNGDAKPEISWC